MNCLRKLNVLGLIRRPIMIFPCGGTEKRTYWFLCDVMNKYAWNQNDSIKDRYYWIWEKWPNPPLKVLWNLEQTSLTFAVRFSILNMKLFFSDNLFFRLPVVSWSTFTISIVFFTAWLLIIKSQKFEYIIFIFFE